MSHVAPAYREKRQVNTSKVGSSKPWSVQHSLSLTHMHTHTRAHTRTHVPCTNNIHARTHTHMYVFVMYPRRTLDLPSKPLTCTRTHLYLNVYTLAYVCRYRYSVAHTYKSTCIYISIYPYNYVRTYRTKS